MEETIAYINKSEEIKTNIGTYYHATKFVEIIYDRLVTQNFLRFLKLLILKGADPNCFSFSQAVISDYYKLKSEEMKHAVFPMTRIENEKVAKHIDHVLAETLKTKSVIEHSVS